MAVEANASLLRQSAIVILARQAAMREVKRRRQKAGIKGTLPHSTLARLSIEWLADHPELLVEAAASPIVLNLRLTLNQGLAQRPRRSSESWCRFSVPGR
jgi:hypothetical protein